MNSLATFPPNTGFGAWSPHVDVNQMNDHAKIVLLLLSNQDIEKMPHETSVRVLARVYERQLRFDHRYVQWLLTDHGTLGLVVEKTETATRWLYALGFRDGQPRCLGLVK